MTSQMIEIALISGKQVIDAKHLITALEQAVNQVRTKKASSARHKDTLPPETALGHEIELRCCF